MSAPARTDAVTTYSFKRRVYLGEDDASGAIFFPHFFRYMTEGLQLIWARLGQPAYGSTSDGSIAVPVHAEADFLGRAVSGDTLTQHVRLMTGGSSRLISEHRFTNDQGTLVARGTLISEWVEPMTMRGVELPEWVRASFPPQV